MSQYLIFQLHGPMASWGGAMLQVKFVIPMNFLRAQHCWSYWLPG